MAVLGLIAVVGSAAAPCPRARAATHLSW